MLPHAPRAERVDRLLLKMHGCVSAPAEIVLTREHYIRYAETRAALGGAWPHGVVGGAAGKVSGAIAAARRCDVRFMRNRTVYVPPLPRCPAARCPGAPQAFCSP